MASQYAALCTDFYINARLNLKMDLSLRRDTVLSLFDRVRHQRPRMDRFKRYADELSLESRPVFDPIMDAIADAAAAADAGIDADRPAPTGDPHARVGGSYDWLAVRRTSLRSGSVNPESDLHAHDLHRLILEAAPFYLDITPLDIDHLEVLFGFDLPAPGNHDAIVFNALLGHSPLASLCEAPNSPVIPIDFQPVLGITLNDRADLQAFFEVKTRGRARPDVGRHTSDDRDDAISVYVIVRKYGPFGDLAQIPTLYHSLVARLEELLDHRIVPNMLLPLRDAIASA